MVGKQIGRCQERQDKPAPYVRIPEGNPFPDFIENNTHGKRQGKTAGKVCRQGSSPYPSKNDDNKP